MMVTPAHPTSFATREIGMKCDVEVPEVQDGRIVHLTVSPEFVDFDGFINYGSPITMPMVGYENNTATIESVEITKNEILQPVFSTKKTMTTLSIESGKSVVFGGLKKAKTVRFEDKVPFFGDLPLVGRMFRSEGDQVERSALIMMVKAELIDAAGRIPHTGAPVIGEDTLLSSTFSHTQPEADASAGQAGGEPDDEWAADAQPSSDSDHDPFAE